MVIKGSNLNVSLYKGAEEVTTLSNSSSSSSNSSSNSRYRLGMIN